MNSLRAMGYSFNTAIADVIDNSVAADATKIAIHLRDSRSPLIAIVDDGSGMSRETLLEAMRHGGIGPQSKRSTKDLGRYGLGLKTASLSQCRQLTVATLKAGSISAARWDLDLIEKMNEWMLSVLDHNEIAALPLIRDLEDQQQGTIIYWKNFDRAVAGEANPSEALKRLVDGARNHLSLTFHRFLDGSIPKRKLTISLNGLTLTPIDPFLRNNPRTEPLPLETLEIDGARIMIQPYILPYISNISRSDLETMGGSAGLRLSQGFYVYRNSRLIIAGTWFRLIPLDELTKLARVAIDIPNTLDHLWELDVKKSVAHPPELVRKALKRIIDQIAKRSGNVFRLRRRRPTQSQITFLWSRSETRDGFLYEVNRNHPSVVELKKQFGDSTQIDRLLSLIEVGLPTTAIYADIASDRNVEPGDNLLMQSLGAQLRDWLKAVSDNPIAVNAILQALPTLEPFSMYPEVTRKLISKVNG